MSHTVKERLARFMDPQAFEPVPTSVKFTATELGKQVHDKRKVRREIALKRAASAIRFFRRPENAHAIAMDARSDETARLSPQGDSAAPQGDRHPDMVKAQQLCNEHNQSIVQKSIERDGK